MADDLFGSIELIIIFCRADFDGLEGRVGKNQQHINVMFVTVV